MAWRRNSISSLAAGLQQVLAVEQDLAGAGLDKPRQAAHQGRLAGTGKAHDDEDLAGMRPSKLASITAGIWPSARRRSHSGLAVADE